MAGATEVELWDPDPADFRDGIVTQRRAEGAPVFFVLFMYILFVVVRHAVEAEAEGPGWSSQWEWLLGAALLAGFGCHQMLQWRRWRAVRRVLRMPERSVAVRPVWMRRTIVGPGWAVEVSEPEGSDPVPTMVLDLAATPFFWLGTGDCAVTMRGPDPATGVTVLESGHGRVVPSSSPRRGPGVRSRICPWSDDLAVVLRMAPVGGQPVEIGGTLHQRVDVARHATPGWGAGDEILVYSADAVRRARRSVFCVWGAGAAVVIGAGSAGGSCSSGCSWPGRGWRAGNG